MMTFQLIPEALRMMTSSNGNIFRVTDLFAGNSPVTSGFPAKRSVTREWRATLMFSLIYAWIKGWVNNREAGDLRRHRAHYVVIVMRPILWTRFIIMHLNRPCCFTEAVITILVPSHTCQVTATHLKIRCPMFQWLDQVTWNQSTCIMYVCMYDICVYTLEICGRLIYNGVVVTYSIDRTLV